MKQGLRILYKPTTFFNQLQWSTHHWMLLAAFLGIAIVETQTGRQHALWLWSASVFEARLGVSLNVALWIVTFLKLTILLAGSFAIANTVWFLGSLFGRRTSRRVLFRRLSVVFTVLLAGYTASHFTGQVPYAMYVSYALSVWAVLLGYFAIREQFGLTHMETSVLGLFALFMALSSWHFTNHAWEKMVKQERDALARERTLERNAR